jgi:hypothetical protein
VALELPPTTTTSQRPSPSATRDAACQTDGEGLQAAVERNRKFKKMGPKGRKPTKGKASCKTKVKRKVQPLGLHQPQQQPQPQLPPPPPQRADPPARSGISGGGGGHSRHQQPQQQPDGSDWRNVVLPTSSLEVLDLHM